MTLLESFPPVENPESRVLILGSMPGRLSLEKQQYYAHPRNSFWYIMGKLFGATFAKPYQERLEILLANRVALWDVIGTCSRTGSLDAQIDPASLKVNDLTAFISTHPLLGAIFFNGAKAEQAYRRAIAPLLGEEEQRIVHLRLPSTSPAHAAMSREQKLKEWRIVREHAAKVLQG